MAIWTVKVEMERGIGRNEITDLLKSLRRNLRFEVNYRTDRVFVRKGKMRIFFMTVFGRWTKGELSHVKQSEAETTGPAIKKWAKRNRLGNPWIKGFHKTPEQLA